MSAMDPTLEDNDQHPDFRLLLTSHSKSSQQALPTKEAKGSQGSVATVGDDATSVAASLNEQYDAYFQILKEERRAAERTYSRVVYEPDQGLFRLTVNRGAHFVSMGHTIKGQIYLYPEEALYLMDRGSLLVEHQGVQMSLQQMWSVYLSQNTAGQGSDYRIEACSGGDATVAMERYLTYAYLKRLGFVVTRPGTYGTVSDKQDGALTKTTAKSSQDTNSFTATEVTREGQDQDQQQQQLVVIRSHHPSALWTLIGNACDYYVTAVKDWWRIKLFLWTGAANRPLIANSDQIPIEQILPKLQIIPELRLASGDRSKSSNSREPQIDFLVYKPAGAFKKRQPGLPDYRVIVMSGESMLPSLSELCKLLQGENDPARAQAADDSENKGAAPPLLLPLPPQQSSGPKPKTKKDNMDLWPRILFAVVSGGQVSFVNMYNMKATP